MNKNHLQTFLPFLQFTNGDTQGGWQVYDIRHSDADAIKQQHTNTTQRVQMSKQSLLSVTRIV